MHNINQIPFKDASVNHVDLLPVWSAQLGKCQMYGAWEKVGNATRYLQGVKTPTEERFRIKLSDSVTAQNSTSWE